MEFTAQDRALAADVRAAADHLSSLIEEAANAGLSVEVRVEHLQVMGMAGRQFLVIEKIWREARL